MSRLFITSDLHLGHNNITKYRTGFSSPEEHHEILFDNLASTVTKYDTIYFLGDIAFNKHWLHKIAELRCKHKMLIVGNHDTERGIHMYDLVHMYDSIHGLLSKRNKWFSHAPIHPDEMRGKDYNIHGHTHDKCIRTLNVKDDFFSYGKDKRYFNACVEQTDYKPILFSEIEERMRS